MNCSFWNPVTSVRSRQQQPLSEAVGVDICNTPNYLSYGDNYGCPVAPRAAVMPVWNNMLSAGTGSCLGLLNLQLPYTHTRSHTLPHTEGLMKPTCTGMISPGSSLSPTLQALCPIFLSPLQTHRAYYRNTEALPQSSSSLMWERTACFVPISLC